MKTNNSKRSFRENFEIDTNSRDQNNKRGCFKNSYSYLLKKESESEAICHSYHPSQSNISKSHKNTKPHQQNNSDLATVCRSLEFQLQKVVRTMDRNNSAQIRATFQFELLGLGAMRVVAIRSMNRIEIKVLCQRKTMSVIGVRLQKINQVLQDSVNSEIHLELCIDEKHIHDQSENGEN